MINNDEFLYFQNEINCIKESINNYEYKEDKLNHSNFVISINGIKYINNIDEINKEIKQNIDNIFIEDKQKHGLNMKISLNEIIYEINLFKSNYQDIIKINKN